MKYNFCFAYSDDNWNPIEWDRAAEELTWERVSKPVTYTD